MLSSILFAQNNNDDFKVVAKDTLINCELVFQRMQWWIIPEKEDLVWSLYCDENRNNELLDSYRNQKVTVYGDIYKYNDGRKYFSIWDDSTHLGLGVMTYEKKTIGGLLRIIEQDDYTRFLFLNNKLFFQIDTRLLTVIKTIKLRNSDIIIVNEDDFAALLPGGVYRVISINKNKEVYFTDSFGFGEGKMKITKKGEKVIMELPKYWDTPNRIWEFSDKTLTQIK